VLEAVIAEGATTINFPDTVGYAVPEVFGETIRRLRERIPNSDKAIWSVHCHNDLGLAVANSLAGVMIGGARQIECTINGLGERAGNTALEEVVMALRTRADYYNLSRHRHHADRPASKMVSQITGFAVQPNKAVVGANAFAHASGIHQDGMLKARETYEIMRAEDVGWTANKIVLGKLSGRNAFKARLQELGIELESEAEVNAAFARFKELADRKSEIFDEDIMALVSDEDHAQDRRVLPLRRRWRSARKPARRRVREVVFHRRQENFLRRQGRRSGRRHRQRHRIRSAQRRRTGAVLDQRDQHRHPVAGRGDDAPVAGPHRQRRGRRPGHHRGLGQGLSVGLNKLHSKVERVNPQP
jgi:2-isopropylmalate synthase